MTSSGHIDGVGDPDQPIKLVGGVDVARLALSAMEGFILSRIDGYTTVSQLCVISGLGELATLDVIRKLRSQGVVIVGDEAPQVAAAAVTVGVAGGQGDWDDETLDDDEDDDELIDEHDERPHDDGHAFAPPDAEPRIRLTGDQLKASASGIHELDHAAVESELDSELHDDIDLDRQTRKKIRTMFAQLGDFNFFELLDVEATADARTIRRAYFKRSKEFHPDRFYTRRLGRYSDMLAEIFKQVSAAHSFLQDEEQRRAYAEMVLQEQASEDLGHELEAESRRLLEAEGLTDAAAAVDGSYTFTRKRGLSQREQVSKGLGEVQQPSSGGTGPRIDGPRTARTGTAAALRNRVARRAGTLPKGIAKPVDTPERAARRQVDRARRRARTVSVHPVAHLRERAERYYNDGVRQAEEGKHLAATASFRLALTFDDKNAEYKEAYERAFAISRDHTADGFFKRGIFEESVGRYETAGKLFVRAAEVYPKAAFLSKAAQAMIWAEDLPKARDYATKAVQADSESADARVMLARVYLQSGMKKNARREVDMALKIEPSNLEAKDLKKRMRRAW